MIRLYCLERDYVVAVGFVIVGGVSTFVLGWGFGFWVVHFGCWTCVFHSVGFWIYVLVGLNLILWLGRYGLCTVFACSGWYMLRLL